MVIQGSYIINLKNLISLSITNKKRKSIQLSVVDYCVMLFFLSLCGNNFFATYGSKFLYPVTALGAILCFFLSPKVHKRISNDSISSIISITCCYVVLFIIQFYVFGWNSLPGLINHISKFIIGAGIISYYGIRFRELLFKVMFYLCLISLPLWALQNLLGGLPGLPWELGKTLWIYSYREGEDLIRNCGFFWEPGAMGGYIVLLTLLFINDFRTQLMKNKSQWVVIFITLLSTQSTGAYISFFVFVICYLAFSIKSKLKYVFLPVFLLASIVSYTQLNFLEEKISTQNEDSELQEIGDFSSTRLGTFIFDAYYISKHPLIGNGLHERTRMADHQEIAAALEDGDYAAMGNGFSDTWAKWGLIYIVVFGIVFWRTNSRMPIINRISFIIVLIVILQGECFLNYPLFLGLPLVQLGKQGNTLTRERLKIIKDYIRLKQHESTMAISHSGTL